MRCCVAPAFPATVKPRLGRGKLKRPPAAVKPLLGVPRLRHRAANQEVHMEVADILGGPFRQRMRVLCNSRAFSRMVIALCMCVRREHGSWCAKRHDAKAVVGLVLIKSLTTVEAISCDDGLHAEGASGATECYRWPASGCQAHKGRGHRRSATCFEATSASTAVATAKMAKAKVPRRAKKRHDAGGSRAAAWAVGQAQNHATGALEARTWRPRLA